ncbi:hypothetical protein H4R18_003650 [Coemansia javaensis]|uniref:Transmembrane protein n=1 Tax=Coemansia javaensis TaxID=2761396 RepID=A0A9W8LGY8_9FUNG|nr:hypothetical protein H4R18_003650 [Coemansia javaensis]
MSRRQAEAERQRREQAALWPKVGAGASAAVVGAAAAWHWRAVRSQRQGAGGGDRRWAARALGLGTMYAVGAVGLLAAGAAHWLVQQQHGSEPRPTLAAHVRSRVARIVGRPPREPADDDGRAAVDEWLREADAEAAPHKATAGPQKQHRSLGARMRAACGFGPRS